MLQIIDLCKRYGLNVIFNHFSYLFLPGYVYFLTQENGAGKTTFFKCLLREISFKGTIDDKNKVYVFLPDKVILPEYTKVIDFIIMFLGDDLDIKNRINEYLELFGIDEYKDVFINKLSKGTKQKVLLIKTLLTDADVYLMDEPLSGLDKNARKIFMKIINELKMKDKIIIIATHYFHDYDFDNKKEVDFS